MRCTPSCVPNGEVLLDGENILDPKYPMNRLRSKVGMVFQKPVPFPMTIYENVAYGIRHHERLSKAEHGRARRAGAAPGRAVGRGEGQAEGKAGWACPAASSSACASPARWR